MTDRGAAGKSAIAVAVRTAPQCGLGASTFGLDEAVVSEAGCGLGKAWLREVVAVGRLFTQISATNLCTLSCSVVGVVTESGAADSSADALVHCASTAPPCGLGASTFGWDSTLIPTTGCVLCGVAPQEVVAVDRPFIQVAVMNLSTPPCSIGEGVTESGTADGSADTLNHCVSTTSLCCHCASKFVFNSRIGGGL